VDENPLRQIRRNFEASGINTFMSAYRNLSIPRERKLMVVCSETLSGRCGGLSDRIKGLPIMAAMALMTGRQLVVHPSLFMQGRKAPVDFPKEHHHNLRAGSCFLTGEGVVAWARDVLQDQAQVITMLTSCDNFEAVNEGLALLPGRCIFTFP
jgi:hypothetical protein